MALPVFDLPSPQSLSAKFHLLFGCWRGSARDEIHIGEAGGARLGAPRVWLIRFFSYFVFS